MFQDADIFQTRKREGKVEDDWSNRQKNNKAMLARPFLVPAGSQTLGVLGINDFDDFCAALVMHEAA